LLHSENSENLTHREAQLLFYLFEKKNDVLDRTFILNKLWGNDDFFNARSMDVFISKLRKKLKKDPNIQILNIRGFGYKLIC
uniref:winged helix-turn-helix domain-containing protein n=1 Tax=uncultured Polaribacter sp. TaxID=174711 RepID=UPI0026196E6A